MRRSASWRPTTCRAGSSVISSGFSSADKRVQYTQTLFHPMTDHASTAGDTTRLPRTVEEWSQYRLAILGDLSPSELDQESQRALKEYLVDRGGTVILIAGDQSMPQAFAGMPLADMLPVSAGEQPDATQGYELSLSPEGRLNAAMQIAEGSEGSDDVWKEMSRPVADLRPLAVLGSQTDRPHADQGGKYGARHARGRTKRPFCAGKR